MVVPAFNPSTQERQVFERSLLYIVSGLHGERPCYIESIIRLVCTLYVWVGAWVLVECAAVRRQPVGIGSLLHRGSNSGGQARQWEPFPRSHLAGPCLHPLSFPSHTGLAEKRASRCLSKGLSSAPGPLNGTCLLSLAPTTAVSMYCILSSGQQRALRDLSNPCRVGATEI